MKRFAFLAFVLSCLLVSEASAYRPRYRAHTPSVDSSYYSTPYGSTLTTHSYGDFGSTTITSGTGAYSSYPAYNVYPLYGAYPTMGYGGYYGGSYGAYGGWGGAGYGGSYYGGFGVW